MPKRKASEETRTADTLILNTQLPEIWENKFLLFKPCHRWYFVLATLENQKTSIATVEDVICSGILRTTVLQGSSPHQSYSSKTWQNRGSLEGRQESLPLRKCPASSVILFLTPEPWKEFEAGTQRTGFEVDNWQPIVNARDLNVSKLQSPHW